MQTEDLHEGGPSGLPHEKITEVIKTLCEHRDKEIVLKGNAWFHVCKFCGYSDMEAWDTLNKNLENQSLWGTHYKK